MTDNDPKGKEQETGYDINADVNQKLDNLFSDLDEDEDVVDVSPGNESVVDLPADNESVVDLPADNESVVDLPADNESVVDLPADNESVVDLPADDEDVFALPADDEAVIDFSADDEAVADFSADDEAVADFSADDEAVADFSADDEAEVDFSADDEAEVDFSADDEAVVDFTEDDEDLVGFATGEPEPDGAPSQASGTFEQALSKVPPPLTVSKPRKSRTMRILVWGAVLIIIAVTVRFFVSYDFEKLAKARVGKPPLLFHKIVPVPVAATSRTPVAKAAVKPKAAPPKKVSAPAAKAAVKPKAAPPRKVSASAAKSTGTVKAYVPQVYPYAIHIASFKTSEKAREKLVYYHRGIQAYIVRVDLGKKGVWYRLFFGHFPNATSAVDAIKKYRFTGALISRTRYACLMGSYPTVRKADAITRRLAGKGFFPYVIVIDGTYHMFVGAHPTRTAAAALSRDLAKAGFSSKLIKR